MENQPLTFEKICELEPELKDLFQLARELKLPGNADYVWNHFWLVRLKWLVGPAASHPQLQTEESLEIVCAALRKELESHRRENN